jgi:hypothetical protein
MVHYMHSCACKKLVCVHRFTCGFFLCAYLRFVSFQKRTHFAFIIIKSFLGKVIILRVILGFELRTFARQELYLEPCLQSFLL